MSKKVHEKVNKKLINLWIKYGNKEEIKKVPSLYPELKTDKLLFIGINPSCANRKERLGKILDKEPKELTDEDIEEFFAWDAQTIEDKRNDIIKERRLPRGESENEQDLYNYFKPFYRISKKLEGDHRQWKDIHFKEEGENYERKWEHIDLFRTISKTQKDLNNKLDIKPSGKNIGDFGEEQFKIFEDPLLKGLKPKIIVVQNALARKIIKHKLEIDDDNWRRKKGFHVIQINKREVPIFFSGMLSGQRALDIGSRKRLIWHLEKAKKTIEK